MIRLEQSNYQAAILLKRRTCKDSSGILLLYSVSVMVANKCIAVEFKFRPDDNVVRLVRTRLTYT